MEFTMRNRKRTIAFVFISILSIVAIQGNFVTVQNVIDGVGCSALPLDGLSNQILQTTRNVYPTLLKPLTDAGITLNSNFFGFSILPYMHSDAIQALKTVKESLPSTPMQVVAAIRTCATQLMWFDWYQKGLCAISFANPPGYSEHEAGFSLDIYPDTNIWKPLMINAGFSWFANDTLHFRLPTAQMNVTQETVLAFQRLYNCNNPQDMIPETGVYDSITDSKLRISPAAGFPNQCYLCVQDCLLCPTGACQKCAYSRVLVGNLCQTCDPSCKACSEANNIQKCTICYENKFLHAGQCLTVCPVGYFGDATTKTCVECVSNCCKSNSLHDCSTCTSGKVIVQGNCQDKCPAGYFQQVLDCYGCQPDQCETCLNKDGQCERCQPGFLLLSATTKKCIAQCNLCPQSCPINFYKKLQYSRTGLNGETEEGYECVPCDATCQHCIGPAIDQCTQCIAPLILDVDQQCVTTCKDGYTDKNGLCTACGSNCLTCVSDIHNCTKCNDGLLLYETTCVDICPSGFYADTTVPQLKVCKPCDKTLCLTCDLTATGCTKCITTKLQDNGQCVDSCSNGKYADNGICTPCVEFCLVCEKTGCTQCQDGKILYLGKCLSECPANSVFISGSCLPCNSTCSSCSGTASYNCLSCVEPLIYLEAEQRCVQICPAGYFRDTVTNACKKYECTKVGCEQCSEGVETCSKCKKEFFEIRLSGDSQITECSSTCPADKFMQDGQCINQCSSEYQSVTEQKKCVQCSEVIPNCQACAIQDSTNANICSQCSDSNSLFASNQLCVASCPKGTFSTIVNSKQICMNCDPAKCKSCSQSATTCTECVSGFVTSTGDCSPCQSTQFILNEKDCVPSCPSGYTISPQNPQQCINCEYGCETCTDFFNCSQCKSNLYLHKGMFCLPECPSPLFKNWQTQTCDTCHPSCLTCTGDTNQMCTECPANRKQLKSDILGSLVPLFNCMEKCPVGYQYIILKNLCVQTCPTRFYLEENGGYCLPCSEECETCTEFGQCLTCKTGEYLYYEPASMCIKECPLGYSNYMNDKCSECAPNCVRCSGKNPDQCDSCIIGYVLFENKCISECPQDAPFRVENGTKCSSSCGEGFFLDSNYNRCQKCQEGCQSCIIPSECTTCLDNYQLFDTRFCVESCPQGYTPNSLGVCEPCHQNCLTCFGPSETQCKECRVGVLSAGLCESDCSQLPSSQQYLIFRNSICIPETCPETYFKTTILYSNGLPGSLPVTTDVCLPCVQNCKSCSQMDSCQECAENFFIFNGACVSSCPAGYSNYINERVCSPCSSKCGLCGGDSSLECKSCVSGYSLTNNSCVSSCPNGTTRNLVDGTCSSCPSRCSLCDPQQGCSLCEPPYVLDDKQQCVIQCLTGYFNNNMPQNYLTNPEMNYCIQCQPGCIDCFNRTLCKVCEPGKKLWKYNIDPDTNQICLQECPQGYSSYLPFEDQPTCDLCSTTCYRCSGPNSNQCTQCDSTKILMPDGTCAEPVNCLAPMMNFDGKCSACPEIGYYLDTIINACIPCNSSCLACNGFSEFKCTQCVQPQFILNGKCVDVCPPKTVISIDLTSKLVTCETCSDIGCSRCSKPNTPETCVQCLYPLQLSFGQCVNVCPLGTFPQEKINLNSKLVTCDQCPDVSVCSFCDNTQGCTKCADSLILFNQKCISQCPSGFYLSLLEKLCQPCSEGCVECADKVTNLLSTCTKCSEDYYLFQGNCMKQCPGNYFGAPRFPCELCNSLCKTCSGPTENECLSCNPPFFLRGQQCVTACLKNENPDNWLRTCNPVCSENCQVCDMNAYQCQTCPQGFYQLSDQRTCVPECPNNSQSNPITLTCTPCPERCLTCQNYQCLTCKSPFKLNPNSMLCETSCPDGYSSFVASDLCTKCHPQCRQCSGYYEAMCTKCYDYSYPYLTYGECNAACPDIAPLIEEKRCTKICSPGYFKDPNSNNCLQCSLGCTVCDSADNCIKCQPELILFNNKECLAECPDQYLNISNRCYPCNISCQKCSGLNFDECTKCGFGYFLNPSTQECVNSCQFAPSTYQNIWQNSCDPCPQTCVDCTSSNNCSTCKAGFYLQANQCVSSCQKGYLLITNPSDSTSQCEQCNNKCSACSNSSLDHCDECLYPFYLHNNNCIQACPEGFYPEVIGFYRQCKPCAANCKTCYGGTEKQCTNCQPGLQIIPQIETDLYCSPGSCECVTECPKVGYKSVTLPDQVTVTCVKCDSQCAVCDPVTNLCNQCKSPFQMFKNVCYDTCPVGYYPDAQGNCKLCTIQSCKFCSINSSNTSQVVCSVCQPFTYLTPDQLSCVTCYQYTGSYPQAGMCQPCPKECPRCLSAKQCTSCLSGYTLKQGRCISDCPAHNFRVSDTQPCQTCPSTCLQCVGSNPDTDCTSCGSTTCMYNDQCLSQCPNHYNCVTKSDQSRWCEPKSCEKGQFYDFSSEMCVSTCPAYYDLPKKQCVDSCQGLNRPQFDKNSKECIDCVAMGYFLLPDGISCGPTCPEGYYNKQATYPQFVGVQGFCEPCSTSCKTCMGPKTTDCLSCNGDEKLNKKTNICVAQCSNEYIYSDVDLSFQCKSCSTACVSCNYYGCFKCDKYFTYHLKNENSIIKTNCFAGCPLGSQIPFDTPLFTTYSNVICQTCLFNQQYGTCTCNEGMFNFNGVCVSCKDTNCSDCNTAIDKCSVCQPGFYLDSSTKICKQCNPSLQTCSSKSDAPLGTSNECRGFVGIYKADESKMTCDPANLIKTYTYEVQVPSNLLYSNRPQSDFGSLLIGDQKACYDSIFKRLRLNEQPILKTCSQSYSIRYNIGQLSTSGSYITALSIILANQNLKDEVYNQLYNPRSLISFLTNPNKAVSYINYVSVLENSLTSLSPNSYPCATISCQFNLNKDRFAIFSEGKYFYFTRKHFNILDSQGKQINDDNKDIFGQELDQTSLQAVEDLIASMNYKKSYLIANILVETDSGLQKLSFFIRKFTQLEGFKYQIELWDSLNSKSINLVQFTSAQNELNWYSQYFIVELELITNCNQDQYCYLSS